MTLERTIGALAAAARDLAGLAWPRPCWICGARAGEDGCCAAHRLESPRSRPRCGVCAGPLPAGARDGHRCGVCRRTGRAFSSTVAALDYDSPAVRDWILAFKHGGRVDLATTLAGRVRDALVARGIQLGGDDRLVPVPLHAARRVDRGYDQAARLAAEIVRGSAARVVPALVRVRPTAPQGAALGGTRAGNVRSAFRCRGARVPRGARLWLVDDVLTSGATADGCARALKRAGAGSVGVLVVARVPGPDEDPGALPGGAPCGTPRAAAVRGQAGAGIPPGPPGARADADLSADRSGARCGDP